MPCMRTAIAVSALVAACGVIIAGQAEPRGPADAVVKRFLDEHRHSWRDLNVPEADGRALYETVIRGDYRRALEIGTSTGHSGIWIAWALSKTGGRLITIDIDEARHREAVRNFKDAGVSAYVDARLGDAHVLVPQLAGPFDFVFIDADKEWYTNYAKAVLPKLAVGGALTAHNVSPYGGRTQMTGDFYSYMKSLSNVETTFSAGVMVSRKRN
jgi:caffeoyl-CoA O-methyltransferase